MPTVPTRIGPIAFTEQGSGPPVVLLHANPGDSRDYGAIVPELAHSHRVIALDWPGYGSSPAPNPPSSASAILYADALEDFVGELGLDQAVFVGNSLGGFAATRLAITNPDRVCALVLVDSGGFTKHNPLSRRFCRIKGSEAVTRRSAGAFARLYLRKRTPLVKEIIARAGAGRRDPATVAVDAAVWRSFIDPAHDLRDRAEAITAPTLLLWGSRDPVLPLRTDGRAAAAAIPGARLVALKTGHMPYAEDPDAFLAELTPFLKEVHSEAAASSTL